MRAHLDLQGGAAGGVMLPIHWGTFNLAAHAWAEPGEWTKAAADGVGQAVALPVPGQSFEPAGVLPVEPWWRGVGYVPDRAWPVPQVTAKASREDLDLVGEA